MYNLFLIDNSGTMSAAPETGDFAGITAYERAATAIKDLAYKLQNVEKENDDLYNYYYGLIRFDKEVKFEGNVNNNDLHRYMTNEGKIKFNLLYRPLYYT